jgi:hypothetical protein
MAKYHRKRRKYGIFLPNTVDLADRRAVYKRMREIVIEHYGGKCFCCGETIYEFLAVDHVNGTTRESRLFGMALYRFIINNKFPPDFRIACHDCNMSLGLYGYCPHEKLRQLDNQIRIVEERIHANYSN